ncbi:6-phospho-beta-glucosidase [Glycomyces harbinensis]|uniref:6-phospho-beta-glucosidase n=1 Tax=Glycomyces harbinensis TaxID=58114 RepID=A0A1G7ADS1_9ACTN|nr:6-phospho-beta-glucosidase [Glycomyces harbinensis]SDE12939.1 6-phospho-beta-glucosidase [Glycomyces harbinensis]
MKIAVVGGGSTYTSELAEGFGANAAALGIDEVVLVDPAADKLAVIGPLVQRIMRRHGSRARVGWTPNLDRGVDGAAVVLLQLRVGGQSARIRDEAFPLECGCVGQETTGAGGLAKALRTIPVVLRIAERVRRFAAPGAWIVDFTNPVGMVTRALLDEGHRAVGLCNVAIGFQRRFAGLLGRAPADVVLDHVGLNHLTWETAVRLDGRDVLPELLKEHRQAVADEVDLPEAVFADGLVPSYYLRYFYGHDAEVERLRTAPSRGEEVARIEAELWDLYQDDTLDRKPELLSRRGGAYYSEAAVALMRSLLTEDGAVHAVNLRNRGFLPYLPDEAVIEVSARVGAAITPSARATLGPRQRGLVSAVAAYEELGVEAAVRGGERRVYEALLAHPLVGQHDLAEGLTRRLIATGRDHLPWA